MTSSVDRLANPLFPAQDKLQVPQGPKNDVEKAEANGPLGNKKVEVLESKKTGWLTPKQRRYIGVALIIASIAISAIPLIGQVALAVKIAIFVLSYLLWMKGESMYDQGRKEEAVPLEKRKVHQLANHYPWMPKVLRIVGIACVVLSLIPSIFPGVAFVFRSIAFELSLAGKWGVWAGSYVASAVGSELQKQAVNLSDEENEKARRVQETRRASQLIVEQQQLEERFSHILN